MNGGYGMKQCINDFKIIPRDIYIRNKVYQSDHIVIVQPEEYVSGLKVTTQDYHFIILQSTPPLAKIGSREYQFKRGNLFILTPETDFESITNDIEHKGKYISITIKKDYFQKIAAEITGKEHVKLKSLENVYSWNLLDSVEKFKFELNTYGEKYPAMIQSISIQLIHEILRDINAEGISNNLKYNGDHLWIKKAVDYMQDYYNSNITIEEISRTFHISTCHFQRMFKQKMGQTPYQYLLGIRLQRAQELLQRDHYSTGEVARICGFVSQSHFSTVFRQTVGVSPSQYKKTNKIL